MARRRRRYNPKNYAIAGGAIGLLTGISQGIEDRRKQRAQEFALRYKELENAADRDFRTNERIAGQDFKTGLEASRVSSNIELAETKNKNAIDLFNKGREFNWNDPDLPDKFSNYDEAFAAKDPTILSPRPKTGNLPSSIAATEKYMQRSDEFQKNFRLINKIGDKEGGLSAGDKAKYVSNQTGAFNKIENQFQREQTLEDMGLDPKLKGAKRSEALRKYFTGEIKSIDAAFRQKPAASNIGLLGDNPPDNGSVEPPDVDSLMQQAREAIANNKLPSAVKQTLRDNGVSEELIGTL